MAEAAMPVEAPMLVKAAMLADATHMAAWIAARDAAGARAGAYRGLREEAGLDEEPLARAVAGLLGLRYAGIDDYRDAQPLFDAVSYVDCVRRQVAVVRVGEGQAPVILLTDLFDTDTLAWARRRAGAPAATWATTPRDLAAYLKLQEDGLRAMAAVGDLAGATDDTREETSQRLSLLSIADDEGPASKFVNSTLYDALRENASDVHLEARGDGLNVKYRIDGVLVQTGFAGGRELAEQIVSRVKVMSELDIAEKRVPQDGRLKVGFDGRGIDIRVSVMPSVVGEDVVLRVLDRRGLSGERSGFGLTDLGFGGRDLESIRRLARLPYGMLLVTGPTGSGKTTTLYAALAEINNGKDKIVTIEDPVEYRVPGVLQIPVNERKGLTFARGLRSILRHDPDKILVGEIRDAETAQIAVQSALTGHLVLTSVHANNTLDVVGRLIHMGLDPYNFVSALNGIVAQRLLRLNCPDCLREDAPAPAQMADSGLSGTLTTGWRWRRGAGCGACRGTGFRGRRAVAEILCLGDDLREMIALRRPAREIRQAAAKTGMRSLRAAALALVASGDTSLEEANRVTFVE
jgi:general secretion pathway protein E